MLDVVMPDMDGTEVLRQVRADPDLEGVGIMLLSAHKNAPDELILGLDRGADDYIDRAVTSNRELLARVRAHLRQQELAAKVAASERHLRKSREALAESEERFRLLASATNDAIWDWDLTHDTVWRSEGFEKLFGYAPDAIANWSERIHPEDVDRVMSSVKKAIDEESTVWTAEYRYRHVDGTYAWVLDRGQSIRDSSGRAVRMIGGISDLTERRRAEQQFLRSQRMESIGTLAGGIAHDLNNVLAPIMLSIDLLRESVHDDDGKETLDLIAASAKRGASMVKQVLSFARGLDGEKRPADVAALVHDLEEIIRDTFPKDITIETAVAPDVSLILADHTQLHQVLLNLTLNSRDAMPDGGILQIRATNETLDEKAAGADIEARPGAYVAIEVRDSGSGIPTELIGRVCEPFFTTKQVGKGTGLGLSTSLAILRGHGGFMRIDSEPGVGTNVCIFIPAGPQAFLGAVDNDPSLPRGKGEVVLVVDDDPSIRRILQRTLERFGYTVIAAADGAEAVSIYAQRRDEVALVITDMMMPVMDGAETMHELRRVSPLLPIIAMSGMTPDGMLAEATDAGLQRFISKPFATEQLLQVVREVIDSH